MWFMKMLVSPCDGLCRGFLLDFSKLKILAVLNRPMRKCIFQSLSELPIEGQNKQKLVEGDMVNHLMYAALFLSVMRFSPTVAILSQAIFYTCTLT